MGSNTVQNDSNNAYAYNPSKGAAIAFAVIYGLSLFVHFGQAIRYRSWWVWPLIVGLVLESSGFAVRYYSALHITEIAPAVYTQVAVIVAPAFIAAQNYMLVGRIMSYLGAEFSPMSHSIITKIYVVGDFLSILSQAVGGSMLSSTDLNTLHIGFDILIGALAFQVIMFATFVIVTIVFDRRSRRGLGDTRKPLQPLFYAFYISAGMIIFRSTYRLFEFATVKFTTTSASGYTLTHEWLLYAFDALPITIAVITLNAIHAGRYLPRRKGERIDGTFEEPKPSRVCGCCCIYKRPRPMKYYTNTSDNSSLPLQTMQQPQPTYMHADKSHPQMQQYHRDQSAV